MAVVTGSSWKLDDFTQRFISKDTKLWSETFSLNGKPEVKFKLRIRNYHNVYLYCDKIGQTKELKLVSKFWVESGGNKFLERVKTCMFKHDGQFVGTFLEESDLAKLKKSIVGDSITVCFKIKLGDSVKDFDDEKAKTSVIEPEQARIDSSIEKRHSNEPEVTASKPSLLEQLALNVGHLYSKGHHDLIIQAGGKEFKAFKNVLMSHSEVFEIMLSSPTSVEARDSLIKIEDIGADVIEAMINWMHFLKLRKLGKIACDLYKAAHKYQIAPLIEICTKAMSDNLTADNLPSRVILAYIYEVEELKSRILRFVQKDRKNVKNLIASDEWIDFTYENRDLAKKIAEDLCK